MRVAVNARQLAARRPAGIARYCREMLPRLAQARPSYEFLWIVDGPVAGLRLPSNAALVQTPPCRHPVCFIPWLEAVVAPLVWARGAGLYLGMDGMAPLLSPVPTVLFLHDLNFLDAPQDLAWSHALFYTRMLPRYARRARRLVTLSEFSRHDIGRRLGLDPAGIAVAGAAVADGFATPPPAGLVERVRRRFADGRPYFLYVGSLHPRKNLRRLVAAFERFKQRTGAPTRLVLAGPPLFKNGPLRARIARSPVADQIVCSGFIRDSELKALYRGARALALVSRFEGFGLPLLEAMACDLPIVCADTTALPEVCGGAARLVDPLSVEAIADALEELDGSPGRRAELVARGRERRRHFSWEACAARLARVLDEARP